MSSDEWLPQRRTGHRAGRGKNHRLLCLGSEDDTKQKHQWSSSNEMIANGVKLSHGRPPPRKYRA